MSENTLSARCAAPYSSTDCATCAQASQCANDIGALTSGLIESLLDTPDDLLLRHIATARSQLVKSMCQDVLNARRNLRVSMMRVSRPNTRL